MFNKIRASIVDPGGLIQYRNDALWKVFLYMFVFALLMSTSTLIDQVLRYNGTSFSTRNAIIETVEQPPTSCAIESATLTCDGETNHTFLNYQNYQLVLDNSTTFNPKNHTGFGYQVVLNNRSLYVIFMGRIFIEQEISDLHESVHTLDFNDAVNDKDAFYNALFTALDDELLILRPIWGTAFMIASVVSAFFIFNVFVMLNTFLTRVRLKEVPLRQMYVMMTYSATLLFIVMIFESMLPIPFILFIVLLFVAFRQMSRLALELQRRLYNNKP